MENPAPEDAIPRGKWQASKVPPGSIQDRGMRGKKRTDDRPEEGGTLNSGCPEYKPRREQPGDADGRDQRKEGAFVGFRESDPPIVVGDGKAVHMAKGRADRQSGQSTHARERNTPKRSVSSTLSALGAKARREPGHRFRGLARLLDRQMLGEAFARLRKRAAAGIDGVRHAEYAENLEENLVKLERRLKHGQYRARSVRRRWIPKPGGRKLRPLGIPVAPPRPTAGSASTPHPSATCPPGRNPAHQVSRSPRIQGRGSEWIGSKRAGGVRTQPAVLPPVRVG